MTTWAASGSSHSFGSEDRFSSWAIRSFFLTMSKTHLDLMDVLVQLVQSASQFFHDQFILQ